MNLTPEQEFAFIMRQKRADVIGVITALAHYHFIRIGLYGIECQYCDLTTEEYVTHEKNCPVRIAANMLISVGIAKQEDFTW